MSGLNIIVLTEDAERFRGALMLAMAHGATGSTARLFLQMEAVSLLLPSQEAPRDAAHGIAGLPRLVQLIDEALDGGVAIVACQTGLALTGTPAGTLDRRVTTGGPIAFLADVKATDRLLTV